MRKSISLALFIVICVGMVSVFSEPAFAVGKYCLVYWRECAAYENQSPPAGAMGNHSCYIHVWNENGTPKAGVQLYTSWGVLMGTTDSNGFVEATLNRPNGYDFQIRDGSNLTDTTPLFNVERAPNWGHYSFEVGFMYKSDSNNPGTFDTSYDGVLNISAAQPCDLDAPRTKSLAYYSTDPNSLCSDNFSLGNWSDSFGQTFVANGNRVVAARCHATIGGGGHLWFTGSIHAGGPTGPQIGPSVMSREVVSDEYSPILLKWNINDVPVTPGQTYYVKFSRVGGMNIYHVNANNYANGQYYENGVALPGGDLQGMVVCGSVPENGVIAGNVKDSLNRNVSGANVTTNTGGYSATTDANGNYSIANVTAGAYNVTASKSGFNAQTISNVNVTVNNTSTVNFNLTDATAPSAPTVTDDGIYTSNLTQIHASWSASDAESGIAEYSYAIGTTSGATNILGWTSAGASTSVTRSLTLTPGAKYYFSVKAKNGAGMWGSAGNSDGVTAAETMDVSDTKARADGAIVALKGKLISRKGNNCFWIQDTNKVSGIKVNASTSASEGSKVDVCGVLSIGSLSTGDAGERVITTPEVSNVTAGAAVKPVGISSGSLAGKPVGSYTPGAESALGPNNVGLLVVCWGRVVAQASDGFSINDGSKDIKVLSNSLVKPVNDMFVTVMGISGLIPDGSGYSPVLKVQKQSDIAAVARDGALGSITGRVTSNGSGVSSASVSASTGGYTTTTDSNGYYTLSNVKEGFYSVTASKNAYVSSTQTVVVTKDTATTCNFTIAANVGTISGFVKDANGVAISGVNVTTSTGGYSGITDSNGNYTIPNVLVGTYNVTASKSGYISSTQTGKTVTLNTTTTVNFNLTANIVTVYIDTFNGSWISGPIGQMPSGWTYFGMGAPANTWRETARVLAPNDGTNSSYNITMPGDRPLETTAGQVIIYKNLRLNDLAVPGKPIDWSKPVYIKAEVLGNDRGVNTKWHTWLYITNYERTNGQTEWGNDGLPNGNWQTTTCTLTPNLNNGTATGQLIVEVNFDFTGKPFTGFNDLVWENIRMEYTPVGG